MPSNADLSKQLKLVIGDQLPEYCTQCGKCTSGCPVSRFLDFSPRRIVAMVQLDMIEELMKSDLIWNCAECLKCKERCPRQVSPYDVLQALRNMTAEKELPFPEGYATLIKSVYRTGLIQPPQLVRTRTRDRLDRHSLGLPEIPKPLSMKKFVEGLNKAVKQE